MKESEGERQARRILREAQDQYDQAWRLAHAPHPPTAPAPEETQERLREASARLYEAGRALKEARKRIAREDD
jgi:hypothetical protein